MALSLSGMERQALAGLAVSVVVMAMLHEVMQLKEIGGAMQAQFFQGPEDHYAVLSLKETSTQQEIEIAYKRATSQFHSRNRDEEQRRHRAKIVTAHETLANAQTRKAYDNRRRLVGILACIVQGILILIPLTGLVFLNIKLMRFMSGSNMPSVLGHFGIGGGFEQRLRRTLKRIETSVEVSLSRGPPGERLGMELRPPRGVSGGGVGLEIGSIAPGGAVDNSNQAARTARQLLAQTKAFTEDGVASPHTWWTCPEFHEGDVITSVNGATRPDQLMEELKSTGPTMNITVARSLQRLLPWVMEVELSREAASERWGCQLAGASDGSDTLEVSSNEFAGALQRWNEAHPTLRVRKGDRVVAVNRTLRVDKMGVCMRDPAALTATWLIVRGIFALAPVPEEVTSGPFIKSQPSDKFGIKIGAALDSPLSGHVIEAEAPLALTVVKEVRAGFLVDGYNQRRAGPEVEVGAAVVSVNGRTEPSEFAAELSKHKVLLRLRPARGSKVVPSETEPTSPNGTSQICGEAARAREEPSAPSVGADSLATPLAAAEARLLPLRLDDEELPPLALRLLGRFCPSRLGPRSFEVRLRSILASLRCEFDVDIDRNAGDKLGLNLQPARDEIGGLAIQDVSADSLIGEHNLRVTGRIPMVQAGDRLVFVNGHSLVPPMIKELSNQTVSRLQLRFSRRAAEAAPGVWEAEVERFPTESSWGMELREQVLTGGARGSGILCIQSIHPGSAVDRWNKGGSAGVGSQWVVEPGDLIVAAYPEVGHDGTIAKMKSSHRVRLTLLRWHAGPAPRTPSSDPTTLTFEVTLERSSPSDKLGIRLNPSDWDPTRTALAEIMPGGLVHRYNQGVLANCAGREVIVGDEVESINGESDHSRFGKCCQDAPRLVLRLTRRGARETADEEPSRKASNGSVQAAPAASVPASPPQPPETTAVAAVAKPLERAATAPPAAPTPAKPQPAVAPAAVARTVSSPDAAPAVPPPAVAVPPESESIAGVSAPKATTVPSVAALSEMPVSAEAPAPVTRAASSPEVSRENFLLKAEVEQLRLQIAAQSSLREERNRLLMDCERLKAENAAMRAEAERVERREKELTSKTVDRRAAEEAAAEVEALRNDREADRNQLRVQDSRLQESLRRNAELSETNSRLVSESRALTTKVSQLEVEASEAAARLAASVQDAGGHAQSSGAPQAVDLSAASSSHSASAASLQGLGEGLAKLQDLSASLEHLLSGNPEQFLHG